MAQDKITNIFIVMTIALVAFGAFVFFQEPQTAVLDNYQYSNGYTIFEIQKVNEIESYITLLVGQEGSKYTIGLRNDPLSLEDIPVEGSLNTRIFGSEEIFVTINPMANLSAKTTVAALEINTIIDNENLYGIPVSSAMTKEYGNYTVKSCLDATAENPVIWLTLGSETKVYTDGYCIIIVGTDEDNIIRAADRFLLTLLGIMVP
jgi:hypothetical protein